uniref:Trafficking protein particle complex subunit 6B n=1 Tax=Vannella robusta TaxID=1487602 RepID=A0A6U1UEB1_9EUKA|mmetsp:Transcript_19412/g.24534  ORF Transcript_19412/g.24534 Transcript_19412/m.24534 type:complete len:164 (+) Transcript_19412:98-589(+)
MSMLATKEVNASCMEYMSMEIVSYITKSSANLAPDAVFYKLEKLGFDVGQRLVERRAKDRRRFQDHLEIIKFVCTELWTDAYGKPIDNLRTNHKGVFMLIDSEFRWLKNLSGHTKADAQKYVVIPSGMIRGALSIMGLQATVVADCSEFPGCSFTVKITPQTV